MLSKDDILEEIRRTAKENGGIPLGMSRFEKETGIKPYYWKKYWARLGDAHIEAGFKPNILNAAYSEKYLFEKFIVLTRELKKIPTAGDLNVKHNNDKSFPDVKAFYRLGTIQQLLSKLEKYSKYMDYNDIVELCNASIKNRKEDETELDSYPNKENIGFVYLVKSGSNYKIGRTNDMDRRHHEIDIIIPEGLKLIHEIKTDDPSGIEAYWHKRFDSKRGKGEWFHLSSADVKAFKGWRKIV